MFIRFHKPLLLEIHDSPHQNFKAHHCHNPKHPSLACSPSASAILGDQADDSNDVGFSKSANWSFHDLVVFSICLKKPRVVSIVADISCKDFSIAERLCSDSCCKTHTARGMRWVVDISESYTVPEVAYVYNSSTWQGAVMAHTSNTHTHTPMHTHTHTHPRARALICMSHHFGKPLLWNISQNLSSIQNVMKHQHAMKTAAWLHWTISDAHLMISLSIPA